MKNWWWEWKGMILGGFAAWIMGIIILQGVFYLEYWLYHKYPDKSPNRVCNGCNDCAEKNPPKKSLELGKP